MNYKTDTIHQRYQNLKAYIALTLSTMCWGLNTIFGQLAVGEVSPIAVVTLRWFGVLLISGLFFNKSIAQDWAVLRQKLPYIFVMGAELMGFFNFYNFWVCALRANHR